LKKGRFFCPFFCAPVDVGHGAGRIDPIECGTLQCFTKETPHMTSIIKIENLSKTYASGFEALKNINLDIREGEIIALLGPNGAGKTTLISIVCGIVNPSAGRVTIGGFDIIKDYRAARTMIGLVPQELATDAFETVIDTFAFSRGVFGKKADPAHLDATLKALSLYDKKDSKIIELSGGMKRRVMIGKALSHEPRILFLDEPTAGVDVELRKDMWNVVRKLKESGVTIILTTHYIDEAEEMADRIGVINNGELILVEDKHVLMQKLGEKRLILQLTEPLTALPAGLSSYRLELQNEGKSLVYTYDANQGESADIAHLLDAIDTAGIQFKDLETRQNSLEEIFVNLVKK
jgi:ABC-2 type transport system ATP-binding protein